MKRSYTIVATVATVLAAGVGPPRPVAWAQGVPGVASGDARRALAQARGEALRARERAALLDRQARSSLIAGDRATIEAAALAARVQQAEASLAAAEADRALVAAMRKALDTRLARESAPIARLLAGLETQVRRPPILQMLQPGSIKDAVHLRAVLVAVEPQIRARTASLRSELARARSLERDAARIAAQRRTLQAELVARRGQLAALSEAERLKARRASSAADREAERAFALGEGARDLAALVRRLEAGGGAARGNIRAGHGPVDPALAASATDAAIPHRIPVQGRIAAVQSSPRMGLTLDARPGALVIAPGAGRVAFAGPYRGFGSIVILEHSGGWTSLLAGLGTTQVAAGQTVVAGSPLGQVAPRDPRITIELRRDGAPVDAAAQLR